MNKQKKNPSNKSTISPIISPTFNPKIKSFIISDGESKIILARQFMSISKQQLQSMHTQFLVEIFTKSKQSNKSESTIFIKDNNRYLYTPFNDNIYLILITEAQFNIIESREILKSIKVFINGLTVQDQSQNSKAIIKAKALDIILAIDDIVNPILGNEGISQAKIKEYLKMYSIEQSNYEREKQSKIQKAHDDLVKGMEEIERQKYNNNYRSNSVTNEDIEKRNEEAENEQRIINAINEHREKFNRFLSNSMGLHLRRQMRQRNDDMHGLINSCETIMENMILRRMQMIQNLANHIDNFEDEIDDNIANREGNPIRIYYATPSLGAMLNLKLIFDE